MGREPPFFFLLIDCFVFVFVFVFVSVFVFSDILGLTQLTLGGWVEFGLTKIYE